MIVVRLFPAECLCLAGSQPLVLTARGKCFYWVVKSG